MAGVTLNGVTKEYANGFKAVIDLDLDIEDGEFLVMVGPSGCGKSTTRPALRDHMGRTIVAGIRPKDFEDAAINPGHPGGQRIRTKIENVEALGYERIVYFNIDAKQVIQKDAMDLADDTDVLQHAEGSRVAGRFDPASTVRPGEEVEVAVAAEETHFFDLETGLAIRT